MRLLIRIRKMYTILVTQLNATIFTAVVLFTVALFILQLMFWTEYAFVN